MITRIAFQHEESSRLVLREELSSWQRPSRDALPMLKDPFLRVQVPNYQLLSKIVTYITTVLSTKPEFLINYWVLWILRV